MRFIPVFFLFLVWLPALAQQGDTAYWQVNVGSNYPLVLRMSSRVKLHYPYLWQIGIKRKDADHHYMLRASWNFHYVEFFNAHMSYSSMLNFGIEKPFSKKSKRVIPYFGVDGAIWVDLYYPYYRAGKYYDIDKGYGIAPVLGMQVPIYKRLSLTTETSIAFGYNQHRWADKTSSMKRETIILLPHRVLSLTFNYNF
jgi:hypothetical protein